MTCPDLCTALLWATQLPARDHRQGLTIKIMSKLYRWRFGVSVTLSPAILATS